MKNTILLLPLLFALTTCSKNEILPKAPYIISELDKEYSFYSCADDSLYALLSVNRNLDSITVNIKYKVKEGIYIYLDNSLPEFSMSREKEDCLPKNPPVLESITVNYIDYVNRLDESVDVLPETMVTFKYKETIPDNYMVSFPISHSFVSSSTAYLQKDQDEIYFFQGKEDGDSFDGISECSCDCDF